MKIVLLIIILIGLAHSRRFFYLEYDDIIRKIEELVSEYPMYCKKYDVIQQNPSIRAPKCGDTTCKYWYLVITDFTLPQQQINQLSQVFIMGGIHGDERIGPNIVINLAEYLLQKNLRDEDITYYIKNRFIILYPMANPSGYFLHMREEMTADVQILDPNRDFPYNSGVDCFRTASSRSINEILRTHMAQAAISFHGGTHSLTYPWGSYNHADRTGRNGEECPDDKAYSSIAAVLTAEGGNNELLGIPAYPIGKMTDVVYAASGTFDDWAYASSWEKSISPNVLGKCKNIPDEELNYDPETIRSLIYLIETADSKFPPAHFLGGILDEDTADADPRYLYGHIPINMNICLGLIEMLDPYIKVTGLEYSKPENKLKLKWQARGCINVDQTKLSFQNLNSENPFKWNDLPDLSGPGFFKQKNFEFAQEISLEAQNFSAVVKITLICDQEFATQNHPKPDLQPQTHFVKKRLNESYFASFKEYSIESKKIITFESTEINNEYFEKLRVKDPGSVILTADFHSCSSYNSIGTLELMLVPKENKTFVSITGKLRVDNPYLEGHLHAYGDTAKCRESFGKYQSLKSNPSRGNVFEESLMFKLEKQSGSIFAINQEIAIPSEQTYLSLIGMGILLEKRGQEDLYYMANIGIKQPSACHGRDGNSDCLGIQLRYNVGSCMIRVSFEDETTDFKLIVKSKSQETVTISGYLPESLHDRYNNFNTVYIINQQKEKKLDVKTGVIPGYAIIGPGEMELDPDIALGNVLKVMLKSYGDKFYIGECAIGLQDPQFDDIGELKAWAEKIKLERDKENKRMLINIAIFIIGFIMILILGYFMRRKYRQIKRDNFEIVVSGRKEAFSAMVSARLASSRPVSSRTEVKGLFRHNDDKKKSDIELGANLPKLDELKDDDSDKSTPPDM